jgi:prevent-host-death family protein
MARSYNMYEAKTKLSEIVAQVQAGAEVVLLNRGVPVAKVVPLTKRKKVRPLGFAKDIELLPGFDALPAGFEEYT